MPEIFIVLCSPEIPGNTGSIGRTCLGLGAKLILVGELGFDLSEKAVRRAGLDYWKHVEVEHLGDWNELTKRYSPAPEELYLLESNQGAPFLKQEFPGRIFLIFGQETAGIPQDLLKTYQSRTFYLPMYSKHIRSLNLSNTVCAAIYHVHYKRGLSQ